MKLYIATLRDEIGAQSIEARDGVLGRLTERINKQPPSVLYDDEGLGAVRRIEVSRVRPKQRRKR